MNRLAAEVNLYDFIKYIRISYRFIDGKIEAWRIGVMERWLNGVWRDGARAALF